MILRHLTKSNTFKPKLYLEKPEKSEEMFEDNKFILQYQNKESNKLHLK